MRRCGTCTHAYLDGDSYFCRAIQSKTTSHIRRETLREWWMRQTKDAQGLPIGKLVAGGCPGWRVLGMGQCPEACPHCGSGDYYYGYGLAGGYLGPYVRCESCHRVIAKDQDTEE